MDSPILASQHSPSFVSPDHLPEHSLCHALHIKTPKYTATLVPHLHTIQADYSTPTPNYSTSLGVVVHHTPGHTPDELTLWDESERMLYVGDTVYEWEHIIFPKEGSIVQWLQSMDALIELVGTSEARICCGHVTAGRPAKDVLTAAKAFMMDVLSEKENVRSRFEKRGEVSVEYVQAGSRFSLICPERLVVVARQKVLAA